MKILLITLSNVGDVILTLPVFDILKERYPEAEMDIVVGPKVKNIFDANPGIHRVFVFQKKAPLKEQMTWVSVLRQTKYDLIVDLRNTILPFILRTKKRTFPRIRKFHCHKSQEGLKRLESVEGPLELAEGRHAIKLSSEEELKVAALLKGLKDCVVVAPGAASHQKRWAEKKFNVLIRYLIEEKKQSVVIVGDTSDKKVADESTLGISSDRLLNLCGQTSLKEVVGILQQAKLVVANDSGIQHLASYFNIPILVFFGDTNPSVYGPWSKKSWLIQKGADVNQITVDDVKEVLNDIL